ncbi:MAG TPA: [Fe-Fe] hydrogenase large subunit C-terminal domain-containing protein [Acidobacteriota bacterium]|nr:[Fe-Fe] hydrogenase large subunit C-terminal domain-containing protein [Acidobacteriota bacterium]
MVAQYHHSLRFDVDRCDGCMSCMRICPTAAVRIRNERAVKLADRCIDCGECIRVCPRSAIVPLTDQMADLSKFECKVAIPSPALYAQFDSEVFPGMIFSALKECGFDDVESVSSACDAVTIATEIFINEYRGQYPLISSFCPTIVRLLQVKYPELVDQLLPVLAPREISARAAKLRLAKETGLPLDKIGAVYITPCPSKIVAILEHPGMQQSYLDAAVSIGDLFQTLAAAISRIQETAYKIDPVESASGLDWAFLGRFPRSLPAENTLSVAGLPNVMRILDDIEKGRLRKYRFIECHACPEGCVGGCLTVENPYLARGKAIKLQQSLPAGCIVDRREVEIAYRKKEYLMDEYLTGRPLRPLDEDISRAILKMKERERVLSELPRIDCGACGAPSCRAFAEDVVLGDADKELCVFFWRKELETRIEQLASLIKTQRQAVGGQL